MSTSPVRERVIARNSIATYGAPDAPALLFLHGFGCDQGVWAPFVPAFVDSHQVVLIDHVGAGRSDLSAYDPAKYDTLDGYVQDLLEIVRELGLREVTLVAHSISAMMAIVASIQAPELICRLVLVAPSPSYIDDPASGYAGGFSREDIDELLASLDANYVAWTQAVAPMVMGNPEVPELAHGLTCSFQATDPEVAQQFARVTFLSDIRHLLAQVSVPALILQCQQDLLAPPQVGDFLHEQLPGSSLVHLSARGHCPQLSAAEETIAAIADYLDPTPARALVDH